MSKKPFCPFPLAIPMPTKHRLSSQCLRRHLSRHQAAEQVPKGWVLQESVLPGLDWMALDCWVSQE